MGPQITRNLIFHLPYKFSEMTIESRKFHVPNAFLFYNTIDFEFLLSIYLDIRKSIRI